jgi:hypothetical protein
MRLAGFVAGLAAAMLLVAAVPARATLMTETIDFTASGLGPGTAPVDPVTGSVTLTFDPTLEYLTPTTTGITLNSLNIPVGSTVGFEYGQGYLSIGTVDPLFGFIFASTDDFGVLIAGIGTDTPALVTLIYSEVNQPLFETHSGSVTIATPEPASLFLFGAGLSAFGFLRTRKSDPSRNGASRR